MKSGIRAIVTVVGVLQVGVAGADEVFVPDDAPGQPAPVGDFSPCGEACVTQVLECRAACIPTNAPAPTGLDDRSALEVCGDACTASLDACLEVCRAGP